MKNLLYKDWQLIIGSKMFIFPLFFFAGGITADYRSSMFIGMIPIMLSYYIAMNLNAYDYKYDATAFILSFPVKRSTWVASKYLLSIILCGVSFLILLLLRTPAWITKAAYADLAIDISLLILMHCTAIIYLAVMQFGYFKFGYMKMRPFSIISLAGATALNVVILRIMGAVGVSLPLMIVLLIVASGLFYASYRTSVAISQKEIVL